MLKTREFTNKKEALFFYKNISKKTNFITMYRVAGSLNYTVEWTWDKEAFKK